MRIALAIPAYRQQLHVRTAYAWVQDALTATELGMQPMVLHVDASGIARARNVLVQSAIDAGARLLLFCDSDTFPTALGGGLADMWTAMHENRAAVVGAAVAVRNGSGVNCAPARPGEVYEGEVGTGYMLIDLHRLRDLPRPWFVHRDAPDGLRVECGEDIYFCRLAREHGHKVLVHYGLQMGHAEQSALATRLDS